MREIRKVTLMVLIFICESSVGQKLDLPDSITIDKALTWIVKYNVELEKMIRDSIEISYMQDSTRFLDEKGDPSKLKVINKIVELITPLKNEIVKNTVKTILSKSEFEYFLKLGFNTTTTSTGIPVSTLNNIVNYDTKWIANFYVKSSLIFAQDFTYNELFYYLTAYDLTGDPEPSYIKEILKNNGFSNPALNSIVNSSFDLFILMHEFYHAYYEQRLLKSSDEVAADSFALKKWDEYTSTPVSRKDIADSDFFKMASLLFTGDYLKLLPGMMKECNSTKMFNNQVTLDDVSTSFLGIAFFQILLDNDMRTLLTSSDILQQDLKRTNKFIEEGLKVLRCSPTRDSSLVCCNMNRLKSSNNSLSLVIEEFKDFDPYNQKVDTNDFKRIAIYNPSFVSLFLGNYYLKIKDYKSAMRFYSSANMLSHKSELTVLCNLFCYEIYKDVASEKDLELAAEYLNLAKEINITIPTIRMSIINSLKVR